MTPKPTHGGARKGAGRKPTRTNVNLTVSIPPETKAQILGLAKWQGVSASEIVRRKFAGSKSFD
jgi:hypothetical protein